MTARCPIPGWPRINSRKLGRTVTFTGSMNTNAGQPVEICGKDATLRFDGIAHDVNSFVIKPEGYNQRHDLPEGYERAKTPGQPNHMVDFFNCVRSRGTPKCRWTRPLLKPPPT